MREFLARNDVKHSYEDVRKEPVSKKDTLALVRKYKHAYAKKGTKLLSFDPATAKDEEILKAFIGNSGTLRAPTIAVDDTIIGGYDAELYAKLLK